MSAPAIEAEHLVKTFGDTRAVDDVSRRFGRGAVRRATLLGGDRP